MSDGSTVSRRFDTVAEAQPDAPAIHGEGVLTYGACRSAGSALADDLRDRIAPGDCVALSIPKSPAAIVAMLACLRAGVPYVPIDPTAPLPRRQQVLRHSSARWLLAGEDTTGSWPDVVFTRPAGPPGLALACVPAEPGGAGLTADVAYVLYTSGSTGQPKGVLITHRNLEYFLDWTARAFPLTERDQVAQHAPLHFDLPVYDVFGALGAGACLHLVGQREAMYPAATYRLLRERGVTALYAVPSALNAMVERSALRAEGLPELRQLLYAGEDYHVPRLRRLVAALPAGTRLCNLYGPVETNVVTWHEAGPDALAGDRVPIGRPAPGTDVRIRGSNGVIARPNPGATGELLVSGPSVSPGYLGDPVATAASRMTVVDGGDSREYYRTGDFVRVDSAGLLVFRGRRDGMIKTRGFRVELGDVASAVVAHPDVVEAVAVPVSHPDAGTVIEVHVVLTRSSRVSGLLLRGWLAERLPAYMVPVRVLVHDDLPRTSTGKIAAATVAGGVAP